MQVKYSEKKNGNVLFQNYAKKDDKTAPNIAILFHFMQNAELCNEIQNLKNIVNSIKKDICLLGICFADIIQFLLIFIYRETF